MDFHILIVIACVFLASLLSMIFINKIFRRKTFEEIVAEKKAMTATIYGQSKAAAGKKPKKLQQQQKKELKREKKQRQKELLKDTAVEQDDSDAHSEQQSLGDDEPQGLSKTHVEFEPDPEIVSYNAVDDVATSINAKLQRRPSNAEKENVVTHPKLKSKKDKKNGNKSSGAGGILVNKNEVIGVKSTPTLATEEHLNNFDVKPPKDVVELKRQEKEKEKKEEKQQTAVTTAVATAPVATAAPAVGNKKEKNSKKEKSNILEKPIVAAAVEQAVEVPHISKEVLLKQQQQQQEEKTRFGSPKTQNNAANNKTKQQNKKQIKESAANKELVLALDKLSDNDTIGVSLLMNLFRRAELNRSEIQILIDYLLNKQQDMPSSHSEWSDDICQKLKKQLEEKEKLLAEEQEASVGIQAKLRELRTEINTERAQMNAALKMKNQEIANLSGELQSVNEKFTIERQQFQSQLLREKQVGSQDLLAKLQMMQNELAHKDKYIADMVNASRQACEESQQRNDIIQNQLTQIRQLEQQRDELEALQNNRIYEIEQYKTLEAENADIKVDIRNLQNALESAKIDLVQSQKDLEAAQSELAVVRSNELAETQNQLATLQAQNAELRQQLNGVTNMNAEQSKEHLDMQTNIEALQKQLGERQQRLDDFNAKHFELAEQLKKTELAAQASAQQQQQEQQKFVEALKNDLASTQQQLQAAQHQIEKCDSNEKDLLQQLHEQKERNNQQQQLLASTTQKSLTVTNNGSSSGSSSSSTESAAKDQKHVRELFHRLCPDAVKACSGTALSASFDQWIEQVLATHVRQATASNNSSNSSTSTSTSTGTNTTNTSSSSSHKSTQANSNTSNSNASSNHKPQIKPLNNNVNSNSRSNSISASAGAGSDSGAGASASEGGATSAASNESTPEVQEVMTENLRLRTRIDELTKLVTKISNTLVDLEGRAREQEEYYQCKVRQKDDLINSLKHSNGEQDI